MRVRDRRPVGGGSINDAARATLDDGTPVFVKERAGADPREFRDEAAGLRWLRDAPGGPRVPAVVHVDADRLVLEWIEPGRLDEERLGRELAALHRAGAPRHGMLAPGHEGPLRLGTVHLEPLEAATWAEVYAEGRLRPLVRLARDAGTLDARDAAAVDAVADRIEVLAGPPEPPARLHGDLWSGNVLAAPDGTPVLVDPAAHGGHRETDLAMLRLFGGAGGDGSRCFAAYREAFPLADGHRERVPLWQLQPLLVHAVLFGGAYGAQAGRAARALR